jgi:hypothetical protein
MIELFEAYWWLLFPLSWFVFGAYQSWLSYKANRDTLDLIKTYAETGREPPPELMAKLSKRWNDEGESDDRLERYERRRWRRRGPRGWYHVVLFGVLGAGFAFSAFSDMYGQGQAFAIVAFVMVALSLASAVSLLIERGPRA